MTEPGSTAGIQFRTSSFSSGGGGNCVEVGVVDADTFAVRHSTKPVDGATLLFTKSEWQAFVAGVKAGEFDPR